MRVAGDFPAGTITAVNIKLKLLAAHFAVLLDWEHGGLVKVLQGRQQEAFRDYSASNILTGTGEKGR